MLGQKRESNPTCSTLALCINAQKRGLNLLCWGKRGNQIRHVPPLHCVYMHRKEDLICYVGPVKGIESEMGRRGILLTPYLVWFWPPPVIHLSCIYDCARTLIAPLLLPDSQLAFRLMLRIMSGLHLNPSWFTTAVSFNVTYNVWPPFESFLINKWRFV